MAMQLDAINQAGLGAPLTSAHSVVGQGDSSITVIQKNGTGNAYAASLFEATALTRLAAAAGARYEVVRRDADPRREGRGAPQLRGRHRPAAVRLRTGSEGDHRADAAIPLDPHAAARRSDRRGGRPRRSRPGRPASITRARSTARARSTSTPTRAIASTCWRGSTTGWASSTRRCSTRSSCSGHDWQPLQPVDITRDGQTISVRFHVPNPPLAWDEAFGAPHQFVHAAWKNGARLRDRGFARRGDDHRRGHRRRHDPHRDRSAARHDRRAAGRPLRDDAGRDELAGGLVSGRFGQLHDSDPLVGVDGVEFDCTVTTGSTAVTPVTAGAFMLRTAHDMVDVVGGGAGLAAEHDGRRVEPEQRVALEPVDGRDGPGTAALSIEPVELCGRLRADRAISRLVSPEVP